MVRGSAAKIVPGALLLAFAAACSIPLVREWYPPLIFSSGRTALEDGNWSRVSDCARRLERLGYVSQARQLRGEAWLRRGRLLSQSAGSSRMAADEAYHAALSELTQIHDQSPEPTVLASECLVHLGERPLAASALQTVLRQHPDEIDAHRWLAAIYIDLNAPESAAHHLEAWGRLDPTTGRPFRWAGFFHKVVQHAQAAVEAYQTALQRPLDDGMKADTARELADLLIEEFGDYKGALAALDQASGRDHDRPEFLTLRAECLWGLGKPDEATALVEQALRLAPDLASALRLRAQIYLTSDQPRQARPLLERAIQVAPHDLGIRKKLMEVALQEGNKAEAERQQQALAELTSLREQLANLHRAADQRPWDGPVRRRIAEICLQLRRGDEARMWAKAALVCDPSDEPAQRLLAQVGDTAPSQTPSVKPETQGKY